MHLTIIVAVSENKVIGNNGKIPWDLPEDRQHFQELTLNHAVMMGRKTYESLPKEFRPLPQRQNLVITRKSEFREKGIYVAGSLEEALENLKSGRWRITRINYENIFIIGGQSLYEQALPYTDKLEVTKVHQVVEGDAYFPEIDLNIWKKEKVVAGKRFSFITYTRK